MHLGPFGCLTKLGAKRAKLVQKFVPRSCVGVFRDEHTRSTPLDPKLSFCCISYHLVAFGTVWLPYETQCKTGRTSAKVCATKLHWNFSPRAHPIYPTRPKTHVLVSFVPFWCFGTVWLPYKTQCKMGRTSAKVCSTKSHWNFSQRKHPIHFIGP